MIIRNPDNRRRVARSLRNEAPLAWAVPEPRRRVPAAPGCRRRGAGRPVIAAPLASEQGRQPGPRGPGGHERPWASG
eukprot:11316976-Alexandrium_andersonii.AAC.1